MREGVLIVHSMGRRLEEMPCKVQDRYTHLLAIPWGWVRAMVARRFSSSFHIVRSSLLGRFRCTHPCRGVLRGRVSPL